MQTIAGDAARWGDTEHLLASILEQLVWVNHNYVQAHTKHRLPRPTRVRRPGVELDDPGVKRYRGRPVPLDEMRRLRDRWRRGRTRERG